jgi:hypothetical protein
MKFFTRNPSQGNKPEPDQRTCLDTDGSIRGFGTSDIQLSQNQKREVFLYTCYTGIPRYSAFHLVLFRYSALS